MSVVTLHSKPTELPPFVSAADIGANAAAALRPPAKISVSESAARHRRLKSPLGYSGVWKNETTPFLVEVMDSAVSRFYDLVGIMGPSQFGKTEVFLNIIGHSTRYRPSDILLIQPTKDLAEDFSKRRLKRLFEHSPDFAIELGRTKSDDKTLEKTFRNGQMLTLGWPTGSQFASRPLPMVIIDERDSLPDNIDGEGDPITLARARLKNFGRNGIVVVASSPKRSDGKGMILIILSGTNERWTAECPSCKAAGVETIFTPGFDANGMPTLAQFEAVELEDGSCEGHIICPEGCVLGEPERREMNATAKWLPVDPESAQGNRDRTFWFCGLMSPFSTLNDLAAARIAAERIFEDTGDETRLRAFYNTDLGFPYTTQADAVEMPTHEELEQRAEDFPLGFIPERAKWINAAVDVQKDRFEVAVWAWAERDESWLIDRFAIRQLEDGKTDIRPASHSEHWHVLLDLFSTGYPLENDPSTGLFPAIIGIDTGGLAGVAENAKNFWRKCRKEGIAEPRVFLVKGAASATAPALGAPTYEKTKHGRAIKGGPKIYVLGVSVIKDTLANRLRREEQGPGFIHLPTKLETRYYKELTSEQKEDGKWTQHGANETFDLLCYATAAYLRVKPWSFDLVNRPPSFARPTPIDEDGRRLEAPEEDAEVPADPEGEDEEPETKKRRRATGRRRGRRGSKLNRGDSL